MDYWSYVGLVVLVGISFFFSAANFALKTYSKVKLEDLLTNRGKFGRYQRLQDHHHRLLLTCAVVRTSANLALVLTLTWLFRPNGQLRPMDLIRAFAGSVLLLSIFSVAVPHAWAKYAPESLLARSLPALQVTRQMVSPLLTAMHGIDLVVRRLAGVSIEPNDANHAEQEILEAVHEGEEEGIVDEAERKMIEAVMELDSIKIGQVMTPRTEIVSLDVNASVDEIKRVIHQHRHSRLPVYEETLDNVVGMLYVKDLLKYIGHVPENFSLRNIMRTPYYVPENKPVSSLFAEFRIKKLHVAVVLDEYGGTLGLVTLEDLIEQIVGQISDEYEPPVPQMVKQVDAKTLEIDARTRVDQLNEEYNLRLPEGEDYETLGGFLFSSLGRIPVEQETFQYRNLMFTVLDVTERKINHVRVEILPQQVTHTEH